MGVSKLTSPLLGQQNLVHGFTTKPFDARNVEHTRNLATAHGASSVLLPIQVHGNSVLRYPQQAGGEADAILAPLRVPESVLLGIQTADCVPIILTAENGVALIHAGWRGFAQGIVEQVCSALFSEFGKITSASIGPCAGGQRYEVGREVIVDIGESRAVYKTDAQTNSCYLDMQSSVAMVLSSYVDPEMIWKANACTISDVAFHSYRREGKTAGRNLSFVVLYPS